MIIRKSPKLLLWASPPVALKVQPLPMEMFPIVESPPLAESDALPPTALIVPLPVTVRSPSRNIP